MSKKYVPTAVVLHAINSHFRIVVDTQVCYVVNMSRGYSETLNARTGKYSRITEKVTEPIISNNRNAITIFCFIDQLESLRDSNEVSEEITVCIISRFMNENSRTTFNNMLVTINASTERDA